HVAARQILGSAGRAGVVVNQRGGQQQLAAPGGGAQSSEHAEVEDEHAGHQHGYARTAALGNPPGDAERQQRAPLAQRGSKGEQPQQEQATKQGGGGVQPAGGGRVIVVIEHQVAGQRQHAPVQVHRQHTQLGQLALPGGVVAAGVGGSCCIVRQQVEQEHRHGAEAA